MFALGAPQACAVTPQTPPPLEDEAVFENRAQMVLELDFGMADTTMQVARSPEFDFLCAAVHKAGFGALRKCTDC